MTSQGLKVCLATELRALAMVRSPLYTGITTEIAGEEGRSGNRLPHQFGNRFTQRPPLITGEQPPIDYRQIERTHPQSK